MIQVFKNNVDIDRLIADADNIEIERQSDFISYLEFIKYFDQIDEITRHNLIIGINFSYGWMPTILTIRDGKFDVAVKALNRLKKTNQIPTEIELEIFKELFNNSLVGTSKLMHFINPEKIPIWDSRVYRYLTGETPHHYRVNNVQTFRNYVDFCEDIIQDSKFLILKEKIKRKIEGALTDMRIIELAMFFNGRIVNDRK